MAYGQPGSGRQLAPIITAESPDELTAKLSDDASNRRRGGADSEG